MFSSCPYESEYYYYMDQSNVAHCYTCIMAASWWLRAMTSTVMADKHAYRRAVYASLAQGIAYAISIHWLDQIHGSNSLP
jgi:hypothetical protein